MLKEKCKQRNIQRRIVIVLIILSLIMCAVNLQFLIEHSVVVSIVTRTNKENQQKNLFKMPIKDLMEVTVTS